MIDIKFKGFNTKKDYFRVLETALKESMSGIIIANSKGEYIYTNMAHESITGYSFDMIRNISPKNVEQACFNGISSTLLVLKEGKKVILEQQQLLKGKQVLVRGIPYFGENNKVQYVITELIGKL